MSPRLRRDARARLSSFTLLAADRAGERPGGARAMRNWLLLTIVLGALFVTNQLLEYRALDFAADTPYGSIYYLVTGLHGLHVTVGIAAMALLFVRAVRAATAMTWRRGRVACPCSGTSST